MQLTTSQLNYAQDVLDGNATFNGKSGTEGFYEYLEGQGDPYGRLGTGVTNNDTWQGQIANYYAESAARRDGIDISHGSDDWNNLNKALARRHIQEYRNNDGFPPSRQDVQEYHNDEYRDAGINENAWFPNNMLNDSSDPDGLWEDWMSNDNAMDVLEDGLDIMAEVFEPLIRPWDLENYKDSFNFAKDFADALKRLDDNMLDQLNDNANPVGEIAEFIRGIPYGIGGWFGNMFGGNGDGGGDGDGDGGDGDGDGGDRNGPPPNYPNGDTPPLPVPSPDEQASPLVLDLDGDGVELYSVGSYGTYFDLLGNGQAHLTGWVEPDDGLLALDINNDGVINDIGELFGSHNTDGFSDLRVRDSNGDGVIDANDAVFNDLVVWTDTNSDGFSQDTELHSLASLGITSFNLNADLLPNTELEGHSVTHESTYVINGQEQQILDVWFSYDEKLTINNASYDFDVRTLFLPTVKGYGDLKDLYVAMSIDNGTSSSTLMEQMIAFSDTRTLDSSLSDWDATKLAVENMLLRWAGVDTVDPTSRGSYVDARYLAFYEKFRGYDFDQYGRSNPLPEAGEFANAVFDFLVTWHTVRFVAQIDGQSIFDEVSYSISDDSITGALNLEQTGIDAIKDGAIASTDAQTYWVNFAQFIGYAKGFSNLSASEITALDAAVLATGEPSLSDWQDVVSLMEASLGQIIETSADWGAFEIYYDDLLEGTANDDVIEDSDTGQYINNELVGYDGNDTLRGNLGHDKLVGGDGNDILDGGAGDDLLLGGLGDDTYIYNGGNDTISEDNGGGNDTLIIASSTGLGETDIVDMYRYQDELLLSLSNGDIITIDNYAGFNQGIETITFETDNYTIDLVNLINQKFYGTTGFDDLTVSGAPLQTITVYGEAGNDVLQGTGSALILHGGDGYDTLIGDYLDDTLYGDGDEDYLIGGQGNDSLYGGDGNDTLVGGEGDDYLNGNAGQNTFLFGVNDGNDFVERQLTAQNSQIVFNEGILAQDISLERTSTDSRDITFNVMGQNTSVTVEDFNSKNGSWKSLIGAVTFSDGMQWDSETIRAEYLIKNTTAGDDVVIGFDGHEIYLASAGDDILRGYNGNDIYHWETLAGNDTIIEEGSNTNDGKDNDKIDFNDLNLADLNVSISGKDIIFENIATGETLTVQNQIFQSRTDFNIDFFDFNDGTTLTGLDVEGLFDVVYRDFDGSSATTYGFVGSDIVNGGVGLDTIYGRAGNDILYGGSYNDRLYGDDGDDVIIGGIDNDRLYGGEGVDEFVFDAGFEDDRIYDFEIGEKLNLSAIASVTSFADITIIASGTDTLITVSGEGSILVDDIASTHWSASDFIFSQLGTTSGETIWGSVYWDTIYGLDGEDYLRGLAGNDLIFGGNNKDRLYGYEGDDTLYGENGVDYLYGNEGRDILDGGADGDVVYGQQGADTLYGGFGDDYLYGDDQDGLSSYVDGGDDTIYGGAGQDRIVGGNGNDALFGGDGNDNLSGNNGDDVISGDAGDDFLYGGDGNDTLYGEGADDTLFGGNGDDLLLGGYNKDTLRGEAGNDILYGGEGDYRDTLSGDDGDDILYGEDGSDYLYGDEGNDLLYGGNGADFLYGRTEDDVIYGNAGQDRLTGDEGNDALYGGSDKDTLFGGSGNDIISGGTALDTLYGNSGADTFTFLSGDLDGNRDFVMDFSVAQNDKIDISDVIDFSSANGDNILDFVSFSSGSTYTRINIDQDGTGSAHGITAVTQILDNTGWDITTMVANGTLIVE